MKKRRKKRKNIARTWFFAIIIIYFIYKVIFDFVIGQPSSEIVKYGEIVEKGSYECLIVRNEKVITSPAEGEIKYFVEEGEKVEKGCKVAEIFSNQISEDDKAKLVELNNRIKEIQANKNNIFDADIEKINSEIDNLIYEIKQNVFIGNYYKVNILKKDLKSLIDKKRRINGDKSFSGANLENLKAQKEILESKIKGSLYEIKSIDSGIISYNIDGYEEILTPQNVGNIKYDFFDSLNVELNNLKLNKVIYGQPIFKIIDNISWNIAVFTDIKESKTFKKGQKVTIDFYGDKIDGRVKDIFIEKNKGLIVIETNQYAKNFNKERKLKLEIIKKHYKGLKIHRDSIVEKDGKLGVYVLDINKKTKFVPIKLKGYNENFAIVYNTFYYNKEGDNYVRVRTINLYDEILRNGKKYKEGEIIY
ncbi:putative membrane fusion protein [Caminicella sporogenes DSM 14501]|uniref:Putative membrane fusion protein n=1 Tax=Caminicella sporogenes DSM 14501 TaxID=1121266 RepID=A0A1M6LJW3_9FIRM|nr:HlyD family efflux transporter periplasmic adaptor subunit [Caminicella sporogenes]RKD27855.1 hypothetical protein BET04_01965 [Caminicella sporogenes]SHJ71460.1 putative membrane fusion protein [Caminicella sporogenes DSM 14501]